jgi:hypothetical protein
MNTAFTKLLEKIRVIFSNQKFGYSCDASEKLENLDVISGVESLPDIPVYKPTLIVCNNKDAADFAYQSLKPYVTAQRNIKLNIENCIPERITTYAIVVGEVPEYYRAQFNIIFFDTEKPSTKYFNLIHNEILIYHQKVRHFISKLNSYLHQEYPNVRIIPKIDPYSARIRAQIVIENSCAINTENGFSLKAPIYLDFSKDLEFLITNMKNQIADNKAFDLMETYPNLYIAMDNSDNNLHLWVKLVRDGKFFSGTSIGSISYTKGWETVLHKLNDECGKARQPNMFFCTLCCTARPASDYTIHHYSARCCDSCARKNPSWVRMAENEKYN